MKLSMIRGTTKTLRLRLQNQDGTERMLGEGETLRWGLKNSISARSYAVVREMTSSDYDAVNHAYTVTIAPSDTEGLTPGRYWFDAGIQSGPDSYVMVLPLSELWLDGNVTKRSAI